MVVRYRMHQSNNKNLSDEDLRLGEVLMKDSERSRRERVASFGKKDPKANDK